MFQVGNLNFIELQDAVDYAQPASIGTVLQITTLLKKGQCSYAGTSSVVATFKNGSDINTLAADEDGVPDLKLRATALLART